LPSQLEKLQDGFMYNLIERRKLPASTEKTQDNFIFRLVERRGLPNQSGKYYKDFIWQIWQTSVQIAKDFAKFVGASIVLEAVKSPVKQIAENAGENGEVIVNEILKQKDENYGFNAAVGQYEDLVKAGIIDPTKVTRSALQNAVSCASMLLITEAVVADLPEKKEEHVHPEMGGMPEEY